MSGSTLGTLFRVTNFGESHGPAIGCVIDGCPPGMALSEADIQPQLDRRRPGTSRHVTQRSEADLVQILSGVFEGHTTGTPICLLIPNTDQRSKDYANLLNTFRPGHADYTYWRKYGLRDPRGGGRASARLTAPMVAAGAVARKWLFEHHGTQFRGGMTALGEIDVAFEGWEHVPNNPFFAPNASQIAQLEAAMDRTSQGGRFGGRANSDRGDAGARRPGRAAVRQVGRRDRLRPDGYQCGEGRRDRRRLRQQRRSAARCTATNSRRRDFAATTPVAFSAAFRRGRTSRCRSRSSRRARSARPRQSIDLQGEPATVETFGRHDPCVGIRATPIAEAMLALVLMDHALRHRAQCGDVRIAVPPIPGAAPP